MREVRFGGMSQLDLGDLDGDGALEIVAADADGRPDILTGEMTAGGWRFPRTPSPRLSLYLNQGKLSFQRHILHQGWGTHMMRPAPGLPARGIFVFAADEIQDWYPDMNTRVVGWTITRPGP